MAKNIELMGAVFPDVPSIKLPQYGGGLVSFDDTSDADAVAEDIAQGKTAYVNGVKVVGTNQGGGGITIKTLTKKMTSSSTTIEFTGLESEPKAFYIGQTTSITLTSTSANVWVTGVFYDGASISVTNSGLPERQKASLNYARTNITWNYSNGILTVENGSSTSVGYFRTGVTYKLVYMY